MTGPRIALVYPGDPRSPASWSGVPARLAAGLEKLGAEVVAIDATPRPGVAVARQASLLPRYMRGALPYPGRVLALADMGPELGTLRARAAAAGLEAAGPLDGIVQVGTDFPIHSDAAVATLTDKAIDQALAVGYPRWLAMPERALRVLRERERDAYARARACCVLTHWAADGLVRHCGVPANKLHVVGIGPGHQVTPPAEREWSPARFLFIGREWDRKRGAAVVEAFGHLRRELPEARLELVGGHPPLNAPGVVEHGAGYRGLVPRLLRESTCLVVPSRTEPAGIVYVEAAAAGIPSIGTTVGGASTLVGDAGRLVDPADDGALLAAMLELADPGAAEELGRRARERARLFTWEAMAARVLRALGLPVTAAEGLDEPL